MTNTRPSADEAWQAMRPFREAGYTLFPLKPDRTPRETGWRVRDYARFDAKAWLAEGGAVGLRLGPNDLVVDVDPRNDGQTSFDTMCWDLDLDLGMAGPKVRSGGGGTHLFFKLPPDAKVRGTLPTYRGIDFKHVGGYVVAVGSTHNKTGQPYTFISGSPAHVPLTPEPLLSLIKRPPPRERTGDGGEIANAQLADLLTVIDPGKYGVGNREEWVRFSAACHDATDGQGYAEWVDWCRSDPPFANEGDEVLSRTWESFEAGKAGGTTYKTLLAAVVAAGHPELVARLGHDAADDFGDGDGAGQAPSSADSFETTYAESLSWTEPKWLVDGIIPFGGLVQNYGVRKAAKTFITLDLALCVATGCPYHGQAVQRGKVTYVAAEGSKARFRDRVTAWLRLNHVEPVELDGWWFQVNRPVNLTDARETKAFIDRLRDGGRRDLIIFDTVAKNSGGMDEDTKGMKLFVHGANTVRFATGAAVLVIHHEGKDSTKKGRGSTVLPGDVDMSLRTQRTAQGHSTLTVDEARDTDEGRTFSFELVRVVIGEVDEVSAAVRLVAQGERREPKNADERLLVRIAELGSVDSPAALVDDTVEGMSRANVYKAVRRLRGAGLVGLDDPIEATPEGVEEALLLGAVVDDEE